MPDYRDRESMKDFLTDLKKGDRVHVVADRAVVGDDDQPTKMFSRGDEIFDGTAEVAEAGDDLILEMDRGGVVSEDGKYRSTEFLISGVRMLSQWEDTGEREDDDPGWEPVDMPVAMIARVNRADE